MKCFKRVFLSQNGEKNSWIRTWCGKIIIFVFKNIILGKEGILRGTLLALTTWWSNLMSAWARDWPEVFRARIIGSSSDHYVFRGFIKGRAPGKLTGWEHDFARLLYISKNFFLLQGTIKNSLSYNLALFLISLIETHGMKSPRSLCVKNKNRPITHCEKNCAS